MSKFFPLFILFVALTTRLTVSLTHPSPAPSPTLEPIPPNQKQPISLPSPPPPPPQEYIQQQQLKNIIDALIGAGDFATWANILFNPTNHPNSSTLPSPSKLPTTATMFVPGNEALSHLTTTAAGALSFDPFIIPYHILPQRLAFKDLLLFKMHTRLPTLLPSKTIVITNNAPGNFTLDDSLVSQPDLYVTDSVCIHGVRDILDYTVFGDAGSSPANFVPPPPVITAAPDEMVMAPPKEVVKSVGVKSGVSYLMGILVILVFC